MCSVVAVPVDDQRVWRAQMLGTCKDRSKLFLVDNDDHDDHGPPLPLLPPSFDYLMPSLAGLFGRKKKQVPAGNVPSDFDSAQSSPTTEYVTADKSLPSSPNGKTYRTSDHGQPSNLSPSSNKLRLPFSRKKATAAASSTSVIPDDPDAVLNASPRPGHLSARNGTSATADADLDPRRLRPPPSKSAIFAAYGELPFRRRRDAWSRW